MAFYLKSKTLNDASNLMGRPPTVGGSSGLVDERDKRRTTTNATNVGSQKKDPKTRMSWKKAGKKDATEAEPNAEQSNDMKVDDLVDLVNVGFNAKEVEKEEKAARKKKSKDECQGIRKLIIFKNASLCCL